MMISKIHEELNENGIGKCSVPMWMGGCPAGFCDKPAYGKQEKGQNRYGDYGWEGGRRVFHPGYCSGLACYGHGGPEKPQKKEIEGQKIMAPDTPQTININFGIDGDMWTAVYDDFINLAQSICGFGSTPELALANLINQENRFEEGAAQ